MGRKMVKGYLNSCGITAGEKRIGRALLVVSPVCQAQRNSSTARQMNPFPYHADYFAHKLHVDQNEKLGMYGLYISSPRSVFFVELSQGPLCT